MPRGEEGVAGVRGELVALGEVGRQRVWWKRGRLVVRRRRRGDARSVRPTQVEPVHVKRRRRLTAIRGEGGGQHVRRREVTGRVLLHVRVARRTPLRIVAAATPSLRERLRPRVGRRPRGRGGRPARRPDVRPRPLVRGEAERVVGAVGRKRGTLPRGQRREGRETRVRRRPGASRERRSGGGDEGRWRIGGGRTGSGGRRGRLGDGRFRSRREGLGAGRRHPAVQTAVMVMKVMKVL